MGKSPNGPATARVRELLGELDRVARRARNAPGVATVLDRTKRSVRREAAVLSSCRHGNGPAAQRSLLRVANAVMDALEEILDKIQIWLPHLRQQVLMICRWDAT